MSYLNQQKKVEAENEERERRKIEDESELKNERLIEDSVHFENSTAEILCSDVTNGYEQVNDLDQFFFFAQKYFRRIIWTIVNHLKHYHPRCKLASQI